MRKVLRSMLADDSALACNVECALSLTTAYWVVCLPGSLTVSQLSWSWGCHVVWFATLVELVALAELPETVEMALQPTKPAQLNANDAASHASWVMKRAS